MPPDASGNVMVPQMNEAPDDKLGYHHLQQQQQHHHPQHMMNAPPPDHGWYGHHPVDPMMHPHQGHYMHHDPHQVRGFWVSLMNLGHYFVFTSKCLAHN